MIYRIVPSILAFLLTAVFAQAQYPGGLGSTNLMIWLQGSKGMSTGSTFTWTDQSGNGRSGTQSTAANQPVITNTDTDYMNYNTGIKIVPNGWLSLGTSLNNAHTTANEIFIAYKTNSGTTGFVLGTNSSGNRSYYYGNGAVNFGSSTSKSSPAAGFTANKPNLFAGKFFGSSDAGYEANGHAFTTFSPITAPTTLSGYVFVGAQPNSSGGFNGAPLDGNVYEVICYNAEIDLAGTQKQQVESYLALKYGITLDSTGAGNNYYNSAGSSVYTGGGGSGYFTDIIGIGRDDNTSLYQRQSHLPGDSVRIYLGASVPLSNATNAANTATFTSDNSYVVMGDNSGTLYSQGTESKPSSVVERLNREWKVTYNSTTDASNMDIVLASGAPYSAGTGSSSVLALLYSTSSADLSTGSVMANGTNGMTISLSSGGVVCISGLNSALAAIAAATPSGKTVYFTLASTQAMTLGTSTALPLTLDAFKATLAGNSVDLNWTTYNESNTSYFNVMRSTDGASWQSIGKVNAKGYATGSNTYSFVDSQPNTGKNYYRLNMVDRDNTATYSSIQKVDYGGATSPTISVYPNPAEEVVYIQCPGITIQASDVSLYSTAGQRLILPTASTVGSVSVTLSGLPLGVYILKVKTASGIRTFKISKK